MNILQIGRYPPPYGGITIHIQRLTEYCISQNIDCKVLDLYQRENANLDLPSFVFPLGASSLTGVARSFYSLGRMDSDVIHIHISNMNRFAWVTPVLLSRIKYKKAVLSIHHGNFADVFLAKSFVEQRLIRRILESFDAVVCPSNELRLDVESQVAAHIRRFVVASSFIGFAELKISSQFDEFDRFSTELSKISNEMVPVLLISGYGMPHYGFHLLAGALERLADREKKIGVVISIYGQSDELYVNSVIDRLNRVSKCIVVRDLVAEDFRYLLSRCDLYIRPNTIDSCGVTVYEALALGTPCVASDICTRPANTIVHKSNDDESLARAISFGLQQLLEQKELLKGLPALSGSEATLVDLYRTLLSE